VIPPALGFWLLMLDIVGIVVLVEGWQAENARERVCRNCAYCRAERAKQHER
jgi:hypothetical protein